MTLSWAPWSSVSEGATRPGGPLTAIAVGNHPGRIALFAADANGGVYATWGNPVDGWGPWGSVSEGATTPGGIITAVAISNQPGHFALFVADVNGGVYTTSGSPADGWDPWTSVSEGATMPGARVAAVEIRSQPGRFALFAVDPNGGVYATHGRASDWAPWRSVSEGGTRPGTPITAVAVSNHPGRFALFIADAGGGIYTNLGNPWDGWTSWTSVSEGATTPGEAVAAVEISNQPGRFALFVADINGGIYSAYGNKQHWSPWTPVSEGASRPGGAISAVTLPGHPGRFALFVADINGGVYTTHGNPWDGWSGWSSVAEGATLPGAPIAAVPVKSPLPGGPIFGVPADDPYAGTILVVADVKGGVYATRRRLHPPAGPTEFRVTRVADGRIDVSWTDRSDEEEGFRVRFYGRSDIFPDLLAQFSEHEDTVAVAHDQTSAVIDNLLDAYDYEISVVAFSHAGESDSSNIVHVVTPARRKVVHIEDIERKRDELLAQGINPGAPLGDTLEMMHGGAVREFANGSIYWHPATGARYLTGPILGTYTVHQGPEVHQASMRRAFGYPTTDVTRDATRDLELAEFEWGSIYCVAGRFVFGIHLGLAVELPKLGAPTFAAPDRLELPLPPVAGTLALPAAPEQVIATITALWQGRIALQAVDQSGEIVDLVVVVEPDGSNLRQRAFLPVSVSLRDRVLYNVVIKGAHGEVITVAPHAVYCRANWDRFGMIHATDVHVSFRADEYQVRLADRPSGTPQKYFNPNDAFRHLIRHANRLHRQGLLDLVLVTGDIVDYQFEGFHPRTGGGNFEVFEQLVLGQSPSPTGVPVEELLVPLAVTLGNHDYRPNPFVLNFKVGVEILGKGKSVELDNYKPFNMMEVDALFLQGIEVSLDPHRVSASTPYQSRRSAARMVATGTPTYALRRICSSPEGSEASFVLRLGSHRIVVLDSKHDIGIVDDIWDLVRINVLGRESEDEYTFVNGGPNQVGVSEKHLQMVREALAEAGSDGVVIVGIHGPCLNPDGSDFAHFLRETEHVSASETDVTGYLERHAESQKTSVVPDFSAWMAALGQPYFNRGSHEQMLDTDGVSKGEIAAFLRLAAGGPGPGGERLRPVDLVLSGHGHFRSEFRVRWDDALDGELYFMDFYTENPARYYGTRQDSFDGGEEKVHIYVSRRAVLNGAPVHHTDELPHYVSLDVPPYTTPLNDAPDKGHWWQEHRPLFLETAALGLIEGRSQTRVTLAPDGDRPDPTFAGFRFLSVSGPAIESIRYARFPEVRQNGLRTPWEPSSLIAYDRNRGVGEVYQSEANGKLRLLSRYDNWRQSWSIIVRGDFGGRGLMDVLFYDPGANTGEFWEFAADGSMRLISQHTDWNSNWTHIVPVHIRVGGTTGLLFYTQGTKTFDLWAFGEGGLMERQQLNLTTDFAESSADALSHVVPLDATGGIFSNLLKYDGESGRTTLHRTELPGVVPGWSQIVPGRFGGNGFSDLFFYQAATGIGEFYSINTWGGIDLIRSHGHWRKRFTNIVAGNFGGGPQSDLLLYKRSTQRGELWCVDNDGGVRHLNALTNWGPWTHIVA